MVTNATITSWLARSGYTPSGQATYTDRSDDLNQGVRVTAIERVTRLSRNGRSVHGTMRLLVALPALEYGEGDKLTVHTNAGSVTKEILEITRVDHHTLGNLILHLA